MAGMATFTIVVSSMIMKKPVTNTTSTTHGLERFCAIPCSEPYLDAFDSANSLARPWPSGFSYHATSQ